MKKIEGKFYPLQTNEWIKACKALSKSALMVLYYLRTKDPHGNGLEINCSDIAKELEVNRSTVSRAVIELREKEYLCELEIITAQVKVSALGLLCESEALQNCSEDAVTQQPLQNCNTGCSDATDGVKMQHLDAELQHSTAETSSVTEFQDSKTLKNIQTNQTLSEATAFEIFINNLDEREREDFLNFSRIQTFGFKQRIVSITDWLSASEERFKEFKSAWELNKQRSAVINSSPAEVDEKISSIVELPLSPAQRLTKYCDRLKEDWGDFQFRKLVTVLPSGFYLDIQGCATLFNVDALERLTPEQLMAIARGEA